MENRKYTRLCSASLGLAFGIIWGLALLMMGVVAHYTSYGHVFVTFLGSMYVGYKATYIGALVGCAWGFADALIFGLLLGWLYNLLACNCCKCVEK